MGQKLLDGNVLAVLEWNPAAAICIACSGGCDSVALLHLLFECKNLRSRLVVVHYDHGVRAVTSHRDRIFVEDLAQQLSLPFFWKRRKEGGGDSEDALRRDRMEFFRETMDDLSTPYIFTAHHRDDAIETLLLRLGRGSGLDGLVAPRAVQRFGGGTVYLRPLLHVAKSELIKYLRESGKSWNEDETNASPDHCRNRIRNELLPLWRSIEPLRDLDEAISSSQLLLREDCAALEFFAKSAYDSALDGKSILLMQLRRMPSAIVRRVLHYYFTDRGRILPKQLMKKILRSIKSGEDINLCIGGNATCTSDGALLRIAEKD